MRDCEPPAGLIFAVCFAVKNQVINSKSSYVFVLGFRSPYLQPRNPCVTPHPQPRAISYLLFKKMANGNDHGRADIFLTFASISDIDL